jgi:hypothetical protein
MIAEDIAGLTLGHHPVGRFVEQIGGDEFEGFRGGKFADLLHHQAEVHILFVFEIEGEP